MMRYNVDTYFNILLMILTFSFVSCTENADFVNENTEENKTTVQKNLMYSWDFEDPENPLAGLEYDGGNFEVVNEPLGDKNRVLKCVLPKGEYRAEYCVSDTLNNMGIHYFYCDSEDEWNGNEFWVGFKVLKFREEVSGPNMYVSVFQIGPVNNPKIYPGVTSNGHYQFQINLKKDNWRLREFDTQFNPGHSIGEDLSSVKYAYWESFVIHCVFKSTPNALIEIWKNDKKIYEEQRNNGIPGDRTRVKFGLYMGAGNAFDSDLTIYFDDIKVGGSNASYNDVVS